MEVLILYQKPMSSGAGSWESEQDVLHQVECVHEALRQLGYSVTRMACGLNLERVREELSRRGPQLVFNLVESLHGDDRLACAVPILLESLGVPYTGTRAVGWLLAGDKRTMKCWLQQHCVPTPPWWAIDHPDVSVTFPGTFIIKSVGQHASLGLADDCLVEAHNAQDLADFLEHRAHSIGYPCFAEQYIDGREFNISLLSRSDEVEILPVAEIVFVDYPPTKPRIVSYAAKWHVDSFEYQHTPRRFRCSIEDYPLRVQLLQISRKVWELFRMNGYGRVDFRVDATGRPWVLEANLNPCLAPDAGFMAACAEAGLRMVDVVGRIVQSALRKSPIGRKT